MSRFSGAGVDDDLLRPTGRHPMAARAGRRRRRRSRRTSELQRPELMALRMTFLINRLMDEVPREH